MSAIRNLIFAGALAAGTTAVATPASAQTSTGTCQASCHDPVNLPDPTGTTNTGGTAEAAAAAAAAAAASAHASTGAVTVAPVITADGGGGGQGGAGGQGGKGGTSDQTQAQQQTLTSDQQQANKQIVGGQQASNTVNIKDEAAAYAPTVGATACHIGFSFGVVKATGGTSIPLGSCFKAREEGAAINVGLQSDNTALQAVALEAAAKRYKSFGGALVSPSLNVTAAFLANGAQKQVVTAPAAAPQVIYVAPQATAPAVEQEGRVARTRVTAAPKPAGQ